LISTNEDEYKSTVLKVRLKDRKLSSLETESGKLFHTLMTPHQKKNTLTLLRLHGGPEKSKPIYCCNNFVYCQFAKRLS